MIVNTLQIPFNGTKEESNDDTSVVMLQKVQPYSDTISINAIISMSAMASSGVSSFAYANSLNAFFTGKGTVLNVPLIFYVLPNPASLVYNLSIMGADGEIGNRLITEYTETRNVVVPMANKVELAASIVSYVLDWETPCYDETGVVVKPPAYTIDGKYIKFNKTIFGVIRGDFVYVAHKYQVILKFPKIVFSETTGGTEYVSIDNVNCSIKCTYSKTDGSIGEGLLTLDIPKNIELFLKNCPDNTPAVDIPDKKASTTHTTYWYSTCDGKVIDEHTYESTDSNYNPCS